ncbi:MAG: hypothetical protein GQ534_02455, partial [Candidatus Delongbacteria bacterium]|nr:hypothetical protein [Candidatus Delongbacteria bacterium]
MKKILPIIFVIIFSLSAETLFEVKDAQDSTVFSISDDGMRVFNLGDTLMVISSSDIKAYIGESKDRALSRSFSISTNTTGKAGLANVLEVTTDNTIMREGALGDQYTNFSPDNLFLGLRAGQENRTGINNIFIGNESGILSYYGDDNIFIGYQAGYRNDYASENVFVGNYAGYNNYSSDPSPYGSMNAFLGTYSGYSNIDGFLNTFLGYRAGEDNRGARENTYVGGYAGSNNNGSENVALGVSAGGSNLTGSGNVFLGYQAGYNETGSDKLYIDNSDTSTPLIWGDFATDRVSVNGLLSVNNNNLTLSVSPGSGVDPINYIYQGVAGSSNVKDYAVAIYDPLWVSGSVWAISFLTTSDKRFKKNIVPISNALSKISQIDGVYFEWNDNMRKVKNNGEPEIKRDTSKQIGFIAQDIEEVFPEMVSTDGSGYKSVDYSKMSAVLLEAVKEEQQQIDKQQHQIDMQQQQIDMQQQKIDMQQQQIDMQQQQID